MGEQEMLLEIERLRRELAAVREDRNHLHKALCQMLPFEEIQWEKLGRPGTKPTAKTSKKTRNHPIRTP